MMHVAGNFQKVLNWMSLFGQPTRHIPTTNVPEAERDLRIKLMREELEEELIPALLAGDIEGIADGIADLLYVTYGTAVTYGMDADILFHLAHEANMKKAGDDGLPIVREDGKILKNPNWQPPDVMGCLIQLGYVPEDNTHP